jgi:hypothetical protein
VNPDEYQQTAPESEFVAELPLDPESFEELPSAADYQWYRPSVWTRLATNKPLIILLIIAFLVLVIGPSLFYVLNPPRPRPPRPVPGQGFPAQKAPESDRKAAAAS